MTFSAKCILIFNRAIVDYHIINDVEQDIINPFQKGIDNILYRKCWIDTVQWHLEDLIRNPKIEAKKGMEVKRKIDESNQLRTDRVEELDDYFLVTDVPPKTDDSSRLNTESPAWAIDRLSILQLKIYHMKEEANRQDADAEHRATCQRKLEVLGMQNQDLSLAIDELLEAIQSGEVAMKLYRQMKMYNDPNLNPILYNTENP